MVQRMTYRDSGVDIDAGNKVVKLIKDSVRATYRPEVLGDLGGFGGLFALDIKKYREPVLVSGTDGVGTKLKLAFMLDWHGSIGQDCVAMCVNDILVQGAEPLFFLDYLAVGSLKPEHAAEIIEGVARACQECGCALIGGETAEMPDFYQNGEYDLAGFAVGVVERSKIITCERVRDGDVLLGLPSSGLHSNGFSLVRRIVKHHLGEPNGLEFDRELARKLLTPTRLYVKTCLPLIREFDIHGMVHVTGGGFYDNIPRALPDGLAVAIRADAWTMPEIFSTLQQWGNVDWREMFRTFNCGIGMILIVSPSDKASIVKNLNARGEEVFELGRVVRAENASERVEITGGVFDG